MTQSSKTDTARAEQERELASIRGMIVERIQSGLQPGTHIEHGQYTIVNYGRGHGMVMFDGLTARVWEFHDLPSAPPVKASFLSRHPALVPVSPEVAELTGHYAALIALEETERFLTSPERSALDWALCKLEDAIKIAEENASIWAVMNLPADAPQQEHGSAYTNGHQAYSLSNPVDAPDAGGPEYTYAPDCLVCGATDIEHADETCWSCDALLPVSPAPFADDPVTGITDASSARAEKASWRPAAIGAEPNPSCGHCLAPLNDGKHTQREYAGITVVGCPHVTVNGPAIFSLPPPGYEAVSPSGYDALLSALKTEAAGIDLDASRGEK